MFISLYVVLKLASILQAQSFQIKSIENRHCFRLIFHFIFSPTSSFFLSLLFEKKCLCLGEHIKRTKKK